MKNRLSARLQNFDYSQGCFFVTICTKDRQELFGNIIDREKSKIVLLNDLGNYVEKVWLGNILHCKDLKLDEYVIMPNHLHGILIFENNNHGFHRFQHTQKNSLATLIRGFKSEITKYAKQNLNLNEIWQRNYYEQIIRTEEIYWKIKNYIKSNPENYDKDSLKL